MTCWCISIIMCTLHVRLYLHAYLYCKTNKCTKDDLLYIKTYSIRNIRKICIETFMPFEYINVIQTHSETPSVNLSTHLCYSNISILSKPIKELLPYKYLILFKPSKTLLGGHTLRPPPAIFRVFPSGLSSLSID